MPRVLTGVAAVLITALSTAVVPSSALAAAPPAQVEAGSAARGATVQVGLAAQGTAPRFAFTTTTGTTITCVDATAEAALVVGPTPSDGTIGTMAGAAFAPTTCVGPFSSRLTLTGSGTWTVRASAASATRTTLTVSGVVIDGVWTANCGFTLTGSLSGTLDNTTHQLSLTQRSLSVSHVVRGCFGAIANGSQAGFTATFSLQAAVAAYNPVTVVPAA